MKIWLFLLIGLTINKALAEDIQSCQKQRNDCNAQMCPQSTEDVAKCKRNCIVKEIVCTTENLNRYNNFQDKEFADAFDRLASEFRQQYNDSISGMISA
jgi:hypothetical protein